MSKNSKAASVGVSFVKNCQEYEPKIIRELINPTTKMLGFDEKDDKSQF